MLLVCLLVSLSFTPLHPLSILLIEPDLPTLLNEVAAVIPAKWRAVGNLLKVPKGVLDGMERQYSPLDSFERVLTEWNSRRCSPYSWGTIICVLKSPAIGEVALANELAAKYGKVIFTCVHQRKVTLVCTHLRCITMATILHQSN